MLACTHELFFSNDYNATSSYSPHLTNATKDKDEQVWPPDVEAAFIQALETIPKLGRRKILVNGKPCGRNELISDFIFRQTGKLRTRKQVSSHIQVLKNTRKNDPHFMRLLTDTSQENDMVMDPLLSHMGTSNLMYYYPPPQYSQYHRLASALSAARESVTTPTSSSLTNLAASSDWATLYDSPASILPTADTSSALSSSCYLPMQTPLASTYHITPNANLNGMPSEFSASLTSYSNDYYNDTTMINHCSSSYFSNDTQTQKHKENVYSIQPALTLSQQFLLWPSYTRFYLDYSPPISNTMTTNSTNNGCESNTIVCAHVISQGQCQEPEMLTLKDPRTLQLKCPWQDLHHLLTRLPPSCPFLHNQVSLNIQLNAISDYSVFQNTCLYRSREQRTLECITSVYSFGARVLETKETQLPQTQDVAMTSQKCTKPVIGDKQIKTDECYTYNFSFINPFFDAFLKGIRSLSSWDEINAAINNLCVIQVFEDYVTKEPLLAVLSDFSRDITPQQQGLTGLMNLSILAHFQHLSISPSSPSSIKMEQSS
ncbi:TEA/ATTS domain family-domain-containing protein [Chlamydoabsidia padenii]|nr:TEA/ATTS domain family-domain-containing protein [Chlamydoabsidia padenii]